MSNALALRGFGVVLLLLLFALAGVGSAALDTKLEQPPVDRRPPRITGTAQVGGILESTRGTWQRARGAVFSYQWRVCDAVGATCADVTGATDGIYPVRPTDVGRTVRVTVTVETEGGRASAVSAATHRRARGTCRSSGRHRCTGYRGKGRARSRAQRRQGDLAGRRADRIRISVASLCGRWRCMQGHPG